MSAPVSIQPKSPQPRRTAKKPAYQSISSLYQAPINRRAGITATSREVLILVDSSRQRLAQMQPAFPEALRISIEPSVPTLPKQSADSRSR